MKKDSSAEKATNRFAKALERRVLRYVKENGLLSEGDKVVVGVSGGPDSVTLLLCLSHLKAKLGIEMVVAHYDHQLRKSEYRPADAAFVRSLSESLGLAFVYGGADVRAYAKQKRLSIEEAARELRYRFFAEEASRLGANVVAVGHTADDQVETVLMHLLRGSGTDGLTGMQPKAPVPVTGSNATVVRPLLAAVERSDTEHYCAEEGIKPRLDETNLSSDYLRNRIRHELLPELRRYNPKFDRSLRRMANSLGDDVAYLEDQVDILWQKLASAGKGVISLPRQALSELPVAMQTRLLRRAAARFLGDASGLGWANVESLLRLIKRRRTGTIHLPSGLIAEVDSDRVSFAFDEALKSSGPLPKTKLNVRGETEMPGWRVSAHVANAKEVDFSDSLRTAWLDLEVVGEELYVRSRRPGDRFRPLGMAEEKKLQDFFVDAKVSRQERDAVPLLCSPWGIAWVVGHRLDDRAKVTPSTNEAICIKFIKTC